MSQTQDGEEFALARLEAALERIARHAEAAEEPAFDPAPAAARLDSLIGLLRAELSGPAGAA